MHRDDSCDMFDHAHYETQADLFNPCRTFVCENGLRIQAEVFTRTKVLFYIEHPVFNYEINLFDISIPEGANFSLKRLIEDDECVAILNDLGKRIADLPWDNPLYIKACLDFGAGMAVLQNAVLEINPLGK